jgi:cobalt/nickel transport system permease protein
VKGDAAVGAGHADRLYHFAPSLVHRLRPECKLVAALAFVLVVVLTPRDQFWAFGGYAVLLAAVVAVARIPPGLIARRMLVEVPFVLFAVAMPFVARGERVDVIGVAVSVEGLYGAWNVLAKATLGVVCSILLAATTEFRDLLVGLQRLRMPQLLVQIMTFMVRYGDVVTDEMRRMRIARESRGFVARDLRQLPVVARSAGALFIRCFERGERVHLAMLSRGYDGRLRAVGHPAASVGQWTRALALPVAALLVAIIAGVAQW